MSCIQEKYINTWCLITEDITFKITKNAEKTAQCDLTIFEDFFTMKSLDIIFRQITMVLFLGFRPFIQ